MLRRRNDEAGLGEDVRDGGRNHVGVHFVDRDRVNACARARTPGVRPVFAAPAPGSFGNFPINSLNGPRYFNIDARLTKRIPITETVKGELKTTFINVLNNANFVYNGQSFDSTSFGRITATSGNPRIIHFTLKLTW